MVTLTVSKKNVKNRTQNFKHPQRRFVRTIRRKFRRSLNVVAAICRRDRLGRLGVGKELPVICRSCSCVICRSKKIQKQNFKN